MSMPNSLNNIEPLSEPISWPKMLCLIIEWLLYKSGILQGRKDFNRWEVCYIHNQSNTYR